MSRARGWRLLPILVLGLPAASEARRSKTPPAPAAWTWTVEATRTVQTEAVGGGASAMPPALSEPFTDQLSWVGTASIHDRHPDGSVTELVRVAGEGTPMHGRAFGLRRFDDGEVLRVERLQDLVDTGLVAWDPVLVALSPARPEKVTARAPGNRALQWTARLATGQFLRSSCPATWTLIDDDGAGVEGWLGRPVEHLEYTAACGLNGRGDVEGGGPVPLRGTGTLTGEVWWDAETHQILRHEAALERTVRSRWVAPAGRVELIQTQTYQLSARWAPADQGPSPVTGLSTDDFLAALPDLLPGWSACSPDQRERELVVAAVADGGLEVRASRFPLAPTAAPMTGARPGLQPQVPAAAPAASGDLSCWQGVASGARLPAHDDLGVEFTFVLPWRDDGFGAPVVVDRERPPPGPLFVVVRDDLVVPVADWLGVPR